MRVVLFGICILLAWRYVWWRFAETLPPLALTFDSFFAWGFSAVEALAVVGWTISFVILSRTKDRSREATEQLASLERLDVLPRVDVLIATYNEEEAILVRTIVGALGMGFAILHILCRDHQGRNF